MWEFLKRWFELLRGGTQVSRKWPQYSVDDSGFTEISAPDGAIPKTHLWSDVLHVGVITTDEGPFFDDVFFVIKTRTGDLCMTSQDAQKLDLLQYFKILPGFQWDRVVEAMGSADNAIFPCWDSTWTSTAA
ncbi:MAG: hypothetical protein JST89_15015 [Cyanobacteria bacterium SZAS-4]|nr:hypothetical protein [Cyanobacteria bacterium SZAS-4]